MSFLSVFIKYKGTCIPEYQYLLLTEFTNQNEDSESNLFKGDKGRESLTLYMAEMKY